MSRSSSCIVDGTAQGDTDIHFATRVSGTTATRMIVDHFGKVGIGVTDPSSKLHVACEMTLGPDGSNRGIIGYLPSEDRLYFGTRDSGTNYFDAVNLYQGKLGIGTCTPPTALSVGFTWAGSGASGISFSDSYGSSKYSYLRSGSGYGDLMAYDGSTHRRILAWGVSGSTAGNVGIGTDDPQNKLQVRAASGQDISASIIAGNEAKNAILYFLLPQ